MKNCRLVIAAAVALSAAACSGDVTAPEPAVRAGDAVPSSSTTAQPQVTDPVVPPPEDTGSGQGGSGCCAKG